MRALTRIAVLGALPLLSGGCTLLRDAPTNYAAIPPAGPALAALPVASDVPTESDFEPTAPVPSARRASRRAAIASSGIDPQGILDASARARSTWVPLNPAYLRQAHPPVSRDAAAAALAMPVPARFEAKPDAKPDAKAVEPDRLAPVAVGEGKGYDSDVLYKRLETQARAAKPICSGC